jgi:hypothetical protein
MITPVLVDAPGGKITTSCFAQILQYLSSIEGELGYFCIINIYILLKNYYFNTILTTISL